MPLGPSDAVQMASYQQLDAFDHPVQYATNKRTFSSTYRLIFFPQFRLFAVQNSLNLIFDVYVLK